VSLRSFTHRQCDEAAGKEDGVTSTADSPTRPLRRDAARNRSALLDAGREVFAARGLEATLDEIAHHAGVGVGTAYRHFANKQELAAAIFRDDFEQLVESARAALEVDDPWQALVGFIETTVAKQAHDRGLHELMTAGAMGEQPMHVDGKIETVREALFEPVTALVERAKKNGCLRPDASPTDIAAILFMMGATFVTSEAVGRPVWKRYLQLLLDGLRCTGCGTLPEEALDLDELDTVLAVAKKH
jgi:AcrR family transcriptional regulator